jgi:hypothetical protein
MNIRRKGAPFAPGFVQLGTGVLAPPSTPSCVDLEHACAHNRTLRPYAPSSFTHRLIRGAQTAPKPARSRRLARLDHGATKAERRAPQTASTAPRVRRAWRVQQLRLSANPAPSRRPGQTDAPRAMPASTSGLRANPRVARARQAATACRVRPSRSHAHRVRSQASMASMRASCAIRESTSRRQAQRHVTCATLAAGVMRARAQ